MQNTTVAMAAALQMRSPSSTGTINRQPRVFFEIYPFDYLPAKGDPFDPADALYLFSHGSYQWLGHTYQRQVDSWGSISRFMDSSFNNCSISFDNTTLFMSQVVLSQEVEGLRLVIRYIDAGVAEALANSIVIFVGRLEKPTSLDESVCTISAKQDLGSVNIEIPRRTFSAQDPRGRSPNDPLYEGFQFTAEHGTSKFTTVVTKRFLGFFTKKKTEIHTQQWSSESNTTQDQVLPLIFGRCQMELLSPFWADVGVFIAGLFVGAGHKVTSFSNITVQSPNFLTGNGGSNVFPDPLQWPPHLGDPGGTGTNATPERVINNVLAPGGWLPSVTALLSRTAYLGLAIFGPEDPTASFPNQGEDAVPTITSIILGEADLPNSAGVFEQSVTSITRSGSTATVTKTAHGYVTAQTVNISGADQAEYNGLFVITVTGADTFTYAVAGSPATPATGSLTMVRKGFSDDNALLTRFILTQPDILGQDVRLIDDDSCVETAAVCDEILIDDTSAEILALSTVDAAALAADQFRRFNSSGVIDTKYQKFALGESLVYPGTVPRTDVMPIDPGDPGGNPCPAGQHLDPISHTCVPNGTIGIIPAKAAVYRRRYRFNCPLTAKVTGVDFLFNTVLPSFRGFIVVGPNGRLRIRSERPADSSFLRSDAAAGANSIAINDVEPWRTSRQGLALIGVGLVTSETRAVTGATYSALGASITLVGSGSGITLTASGATLGGGSTTVPYSGTLTVSGSPSAGDVLTATIDGVVVAYTLNAADSLNSAAAMLAAAINATWSLKQYTRAVAVGAVVTIYSKLGSLQFPNPLPNTLAFWKMDSLPALDSTGGGNTLTATGSPSVVAGKIGNAIGGLNGTKYLTAPSHLPPTAFGEDSYCLWFWCKRSSVETHTLVAAEAGVVAPHDTDFVIVWNDLDFIQVNVSDSGAIVSANGSMPSDGQWHLVVFSYKATIGDPTNTELRLTIDNQPTISTIIDETINSFSGVGNLGSPLYVGNGRLSSGGTVAHSIDAMGITHTIPTAADLATLWNAGQGTEGGLTNAHVALLASPTVAPTAIAVGSGSLRPGVYDLAYSFTSGTGETFISPRTQVTIAAGQKISVSTVSLPAGAAGINWYLSKAAGDPTLGFLINNVGAAFTINVLPSSDADGEPIGNSAGEETIRVMASFTQENIRKEKDDGPGKFKWPLSDRETSTNQIKIKYREASADFAERELYVNDYAHQKRIGKVNSVEIDGSGIDNYNQASRLANSRLSKEREGNFFCEWDTDEAGLLFEEGDVVCATDVTGGFVNLPLRIEQLNIQENLDVTFTGRLYSTIMYSDATGQHPIVIPSSLKYLNSPPPVATNLVLVETFSGALRGDFDFGGFGAIQRAGLYLKRDTAPADANFRRIDVVLPDATGAVSQTITSLTRSGAVATATIVNHGYQSGRQIVVTGATQPEYNGTFSITVTGANTFTFAVSGTPATPATGTIKSTTKGAHGSFEIPGLADGVYEVKIVTESIYGHSASSGHPTGTITIQAQAISDVLTALDAYGDRLIQFTGHPRPGEVPETYAVEIWPSALRADPLTIIRTLPVSLTTNHPVLLVKPHAFTVT